jgi:hypothetical protein
MTGYVAEINGRAIAAFNAKNDIQVEERASSKPFRGDFTVLENEGAKARLWLKRALAQRISEVEADLAELTAPLGRQ